jgi:hypothetical protein
MTCSGCAWRKIEAPHKCINGSYGGGQSREKNSGEQPRNTETFSKIEQLALDLQRRNLSVGPY